jgi:hypothetical protein
MTNPTQEPSLTNVAVDRNGQLHDTNDIELLPESLVPPLRCADCGATLEAVRAYPRRDGPRVIHVAAHYRLAPGAAHETTCPWATGEPSRRSDARRVAQPQASSLVYSLVVPSHGHGPTNTWRHRSHRPNHRPAINSATTIANLLRRHGEDAVNIGLDYRGRTIYWYDFLFTGEVVPRLERLLQEEQLSHPIAVVSTIGGTTVARSGRSYRAEMAESLRPAQRLPRQSRLVLRSSNERLLNSLGQEHPIVALGWWGIRHTKQGNTPAEITLWVNRRWQIDAYVP